MIRSAQFQTDQQLVNFMHAEGISPSAVVLWNTTIAGWTSILYEDGTARTYVDGKPDWAGLSYGTSTNIPTPAGVLVEVKAKRTSVVGEVLGVGTRAYTDTLAQGYVTPKSLTISDSEGSAPSVVDNGLGALVLVTNGAVRGTVNYSTKAIAITWHHDEVPTGNILATYNYSTLPGSSNVPSRVELDSLLITCVSGPGVTTVDWKVYEDAAAAHPYIASGTTAIVAGQSVNVDLADILSLNLDTTNPNSRWIEMGPGNAVNVFQVQLRWKNPSWKTTLG